MGKPRVSDMDAKQYLDNLHESVSFLKSQISHTPDWVLVSGSGLGSIAEKVINPIVIPYKEIPHFPLSSVKGHEGNLVFGELEGKSVVVQQGRVHLYEGYSGPEVAFPVRALGLLGAQFFFVTNSAGGLNGEVGLGDLMLLTNHISLFGEDPTIGVYHPELGDLFYDVYEPFDKELCAVARDSYSKLGIPLHEGTYVIYKGCSYESRAEIEMLSRLGGDAVGKSTVPEVLAAKQLGMRVLGISCITADVSPQGVLAQQNPINHDDILEAGYKAEEKFQQLVLDILRSCEL